MANNNITIKLSPAERKKLENKLNSETFKRLVALDVKIVSIDAELNAKKLAPKNLGNLRNSISAKQIDELNWQLFASEIYAPFVEFGTGGKVDKNIPKGFKSFAKQFKNSATGSFEDGLISIKSWCRNKGIDEKFAYPILVSLIENGMEAQPYMIPSLKIAQSQLRRRIKKTIKDFGKQ